MPSRAMIIVGGGSSSRYGSDKLMADIHGRPLIDHTIAAVVDHVDLCVVVCPPEIWDVVAELRPGIEVTAGGATRTLSEMAGLAMVGDRADLIGIHDAARPVIDGVTIDLLFDTAHAEGGAIPLLAPDRLILDRKTHRPVEGIRRAQTPQVFRAPQLMAAYVRAAEAGFDGHDTAEIVERFGEARIVGVEGNTNNVKVTYPEDLDLVRDLLSGSSRT